MRATFGSDGGGGGGRGAWEEQNRNLEHEEKSFLSLPGIPPDSKIRTRANCSQIILKFSGGTAE